jgi:hypothetical protein
MPHSKCHDFQIVRVEAVDHDCSPKFGDICEYKIESQGQPFAISKEGNSQIRFKESSAKSSIVKALNLFLSHINLMASMKSSSVRALNLFLSHGQHQLVMLGNSIYFYLFTRLMSNPISSKARSLNLFLCLTKTHGQRE